MAGCPAVQDGIGRVPARERRSGRSGYSSVPIYEDRRAWPRIS